MKDLKEIGRDAAKDCDLDRKIARLKEENSYLKKKCDHLIKEIDVCESRTNFLADINEQIDRDSIRKINGNGDAVAVLALSDFHIEERIQASVINGINEYNPDIAAKRCERVFQGAVQLVDIARGFSKINNAVVWLGGDFISGYIHDELVESNFMSPSEAVLFVEDLLVKGIRFFKREASLKNITIPTSFGNHGRSTEKRKVSTSYANSWEWLMYKTLEKNVRDPGLSWKVENGYFNWVDLFGNYKIRFHHGDNMSFKSGVGGIGIPVNKAISQWNKVQAADLDIFGHFHQSVEMNRWICNGCVCGYGPFALSIRAEPEPPQQTMVIISKKRGKILKMPVFAE